MTTDLQAVILAGGLGTRLGSTCASIPKPLLRIGGRPILEHQIILLKRYGIERIILMTGHLAEQIEQFCGDGSQWGVRISYYREPYPLGTAGGMHAVADRLTGDFVVLYGDVMLGMNLQRLLAFHAERRSDATLVLHPNDHPFDSDLVETDGQDRVIAMHPKPHPPNRYYRNLVNAAVYVLTPRILPFIEKDTKADFGRDIFPRAIGALRMFGYRTREYVKDVGTPERLEEVEGDCRSGRIERWVFDLPRPAVFLDRDGVINTEIGLLHTPDQFELLPHAAEGIKEINASEYLAVVVTNQSVVARNLCDLPTLDTIHNKMETLLGMRRAKLDGIYYCPHHPDKGYPEENPDYKIVCACRKPKTGLIDRAVQDLHIAVENSFLVGDAESDILCGRAAGLTTIGLRCGRGCRDCSVEPDYFFDDLYEAACFITRSPCRGMYEKIFSAVMRTNKRPFIIAIGGNSRAGKTVLARYTTLMLEKNGANVLHVALDNWLLPVEQRAAAHDVFERFQMSRMEHDVQRLLRGEDLQRKKYNQYSRRISDTVVHYRLRDVTVVIFDGVIALASPWLRSQADLKIFCSIEHTLFLKRFYAFYRWKGLAEADIERLFTERAAVEYDIIENSRRFADLTATAAEFLP